jgi:hypothetical protein
MGSGVAPGSRLERYFSSFSLAIAASVAQR